MKVLVAGLGLEPRSRTYEDREVTFSLSCDICEMPPNLSKDTLGISIEFYINLLSI